MLHHAGFTRIAAFLAALVLIVGGFRQPTNAQVSAPFRVYLTFEDGPTDAYTPQILDILSQYGAKATFLIAGKQIEGHEDLMQREVREGHALINHLWEEPGVYAGAPDDAVRESYLKTEDAIRAALGDELPKYDAQIKMFWQPGGGAHPLPSIEGVQVVSYNWNVNSDDCGWGLHGVDLDSTDFDKAVLDNILNTPQSENQLFNAYDYGDGAVIAMHDINRVTGRVLPTILAELQSAGASFEALPRPWDSVNSMPIALGTPPTANAGVPGLSLRTMVLDYSHVRAASAMDGAIVTTLDPNAAVTAIGHNGTWIQIQYDGGTGWISRPLVKIYGPIPSLPVTG